MKARTLIIGAVAAILCVGVATWDAQAMTGTGASQVSVATKTLRSVEPATCRGWGYHCPPGYFWSGRRCLPCY